VTKPRVGFVHALFFTIGVTTPVVVHELPGPVLPWSILVVVVWLATCDVLEVCSASDY
jgi:hypothetical protein